MCTVQLCFVPLISLLAHLDMDMDSVMSASCYLAFLFVFGSFC